VSALFTIGYEGRCVAELIADLRTADVTSLVDVRRTPLSRKPGMSKTRLSAALAEAGIEYLHLRELGNPKDNRAAFRRGAPQARELLRDRLRAEPGRAAVLQAAELARTRIVALLCFEHEPATCHRILVAEEIVRLDPNLTVTAL